MILLEKCDNVRRVHRGPFEQVAPYDSGILIGRGDGRREVIQIGDSAVPNRRGWDLVAQGDELLFVVRVNSDWTVEHPLNCGILGGYRAISPERGHYASGVWPTVEDKFDGGIDFFQLPVLPAPDDEKPAPLSGLFAGSGRMADLTGFEFWGVFSDTSETYQTIRQAVDSAETMRQALAHSISVLDDITLISHRHEHRYLIAADYQSEDVVTIHPSQQLGDSIVAIERDGVVDTYPLDTWGQDIIKEAEAWLERSKAGQVATA